MQRFLFFFTGFISNCLFCRIMWIIINVNPDMMHICFFLIGLLYLFYFQGLGVLRIWRGLHIDIYFCY